MRRKSSDIQINYFSFVDIFMGAIGVLIFVSILIALMAAQIERSNQTRITTVREVSTADQSIYLFTFNNELVEVYQDDRLRERIYGFFLADYIILNYLDLITAHNADYLAGNEDQLWRIVFVVYPEGDSYFNRFYEWFSELENEDLFWGIVYLQSGERMILHANEAE